MQTEIVAQKSTRVAKKSDFWGGLECMSSGEGLMADWRWALGSSLPFLSPLLKPTEKQADAFPCPARPACECRHEVQETDFGLVAVCMCGPGECEPYRIEPKDVLVYGLDLAAFGDEIRRALGFSEPNGSAYCSLGLREIGVYAAMAAPVYLSLARSEALLREVQKVLAMREGPFLLLTPTGAAWTPAAETTARPHAGVHVALSAVLAKAENEEGRTENGERGSFRTDTVFRSNGMIEPMLAEFARRVASLRGSSGTLVSIHREIASVRKDFGELRSAKQRLEKMLGDGVFAFTRKVDATSFKVLCTILAEGDVAKAARRLEIGDPLMRYYLGQWKERGGAYSVMLDLVRWRKKVGRKETLALNEAILHEKAERTDYPGLLSDVLDGLLSMSDENWQERCEELQELVRPAVR